MRRNFNFLIYSIISVFIFVNCRRICTERDFHYEFTECDDSGGRWRVSIPDSDCRVDHVPPAPVRVTDCSASCDQGYYFNVSKLDCEQCPPGTYSLGGGVHFSSWKRLPQGFHAYTEAFRSTITIGRRRADVDCSQYGWKPRGDVLASSGGPCAAVLVYTVRLVKPGALLYTYQYSDEDIIFEFQAQDEQCQSIDEAEEAKWPPLTEEGQWRKVRVELKPGLNVLHWKTIGIDIRGSPRAVMIKTIQINGVAYTSECSSCTAGTYSDEGASHCSDCPAGSFSLQGSDKCKSCNSKSHYAPKGSPKCLKRPPCTQQDYYEIDSSCNEKNQTRAVYKWVEPRVCRDDIRSAVTLPPSGKLKTCPPCNPGMYYKSGTGCIFCPKYMQSDGITSCKPCPPNTAPNYGHQYTWWAELPSTMSTTCMPTEDSACSQEKSWQPGGDHLHSGPGHADDAYLVLTLKVAGFRGREGFVNGQPMEVGRISFTFELQCTSECEFVFMESSTRREASILQSWRGSHKRSYYSYLITRNDSYSFSWAFQKEIWEKSYLGSTSRLLDSDMAKIYNINVSNTIDGGASSCLPCPQGVLGEGCIPCPLGHYIDDKTTVCTQCPPNTVVTDALPYGPDACLSCGPGLSSMDKLTCSAKCSLTVEDSHYDLRNISKARVTVGSTLFTSSGTKYFHMFNMSLCGDAFVTCSNNVSYNHEGEMTSVTARVCRSTIIPGQEESSKISLRALATQSVSLGDHLVGITQNYSLHGNRVIKEFIDENKQDLNFFYTTPSATRACPEGRSTTITLRCVPEESGQGQITLPHQCPDGTCDGCNFHFLWSTPLACPICSDESLIIVKGECINGEQQIHYIAPDTCHAPEVLPKGKSVSCITKLPFIVEMITLGALVIAVFLSLLLFCLWKKNKKLEYKYMKLIANTNSKDGVMELPPAESCALDDGEEEEVQFAQKPTSGILNKFKYKQNNPVLLGKSSSKKGTVGNSRVYPLS